ncbi:MAG: hypothetical protein H7Y14_07255 [Burkholderiales bacterium]|nr:hypothetical protein [Burkholderiales bacterium]
MRDWPTPLVFLVRLVAFGGFVAVVTWIGWKLGGKPWALIGFLVSLPVLAFSLSRPLVQLIEDGFAWTAAQPLRKWQGNYYEFGGVQVRVVEDDDALWFAADDVIKATGIEAVGGALPESRLIAELRLSCLTIDGVETLLARHPSHESGRFILWARREVFTPWERKRSGAMVPR